MKIYGTPGKQPIINIQNEFVHSVMVDETFAMVASHIDESLVAKIENGEYIDFAKLLPRDRIRPDEETEMKMIMKAGRTYYVPVNEGSAITGFNKWELAFRIFSNIYTKAHPGRASELIQYNHIIHMASLRYVWENVYAYDKDFRTHLSRHPGRSWGIILQQSWTLRLQDKIRFSDFHERFGNNKGRTNSSHHGGNEVCRKFNRGKCNFGSACKYDHRCSYCYKFGHPSLSCRKASADRTDNTQKTPDPQQVVKEETKDRL